MVKTLRIVMASPRDTDEERERFDRVVREVDEWAAADRGVQLHAYRWETMAHPGFHVKGPQGLIDDKLKIEDCHLLVGAFYKRFGTAGMDGKTGTEHEIEAAERAWAAYGAPQIMLWHRKVSLDDPDEEDLAQYQQVHSFLKRRQSKALMGKYTEPDEFEWRFRKALMAHIRENFNRLEVGVAPSARDSAAVLLNTWSWRDWTAEELEAALAAYDELSPRARTALEKDKGHFEKRNALRLIFAKRKVEDVVAAYGCSARWPVLTGVLRPKDFAGLLKAAQNIEELLIGFYSLTVRTQGRVQDALRCMQPLNVGRIATAILSSLEELRDESYAAALQILREKFREDDLKGRAEGMARLASAMRMGESFDDSLEIASMMDGPAGISVMETLVSEMSRMSERDIETQERMDKLSRALVKLRPAEFTSGEPSEDHTQATYTDLDRQ